MFIIRKDQFLIVPYSCTQVLVVILLTIFIYNESFGKKCTNYLPYIKVKLSEHVGVADTNAIKKYHYYTNIAEVLICKNDYKQAVSEYDSCFKLPVIPFAQDIYNAAICEIKNKNYKKSVYYCVKLIDKGCTLAFFNKSSFSKLKSQKKYWALFQKQYTSRRNKFLAKVDTTLINTIQKMIVADQNYFCERPKRLNDNIFLDSLFNNDKFLSQSLDGLFKKYGYLSEEIIGANISDTLMSVYPMFNVLIRHHYQLKEYNLTNTLESAVEDGFLKPDIFCSWYTFQKKPVGYGEDFFIIKYKCNFYESKYESIKQKIASNRSSMWLPPLTDLKEKIILTQCLNNHEFLFYAPVAILSQDMDKKSEESFSLFNTRLPYKVKGCQ